LADYPIIAEFEVDPYYILQIISLVTSSPPLCTRKSVLTLEASTLKVWWDRTVESLAKSLEILRDDCGVFTPRWLPYHPLVVPLAAVLAKLTRPGSPTTGAIRQKLIRWFWCAVFGQTYDQGSNTQASRDVPGEIPRKPLRDSSSIPVSSETPRRGRVPSIVGRCVWS
jgi:hypothetical protein